jgi:2'-5' RNA ligase
MWRHEIADRGCPNEPDEQGLSGMETVGKDRPGEEGLQRLFLAIPISEELRAVIGRFMDEFRPRAARFFEQGRGISWVPLPNMHLTLKFFGDVGADGTDRIIRSVEEYVRSIPGRRMELHGVGSFPRNARSPRVIWIGCRGEVEDMTSDVQGLEYRLERIGWAREKRPFRPHLTIARIRRPPLEGAALTSLLDEFREEPFGTWQVNEWILYRSELLASGAVYHSVHRFPLAR